MKKLVLKKDVIVRLEEEQMRDIRGGWQQSQDSDCDSLCPCDQPTGDFTCEGGGGICTSMMIC